MRFKLLFILLSGVIIIFAEDNYKIFIVASYEASHVCGKPQEDGVMKGLNKSGFFEGINLSVQRYYMNTKQKNTTKKMMRKQGEFALNEIAEFDPDIVVVLDDNAFREVALSLCGNEKYKIVFSGMNGQIETYNSVKNFSDGRKPVSNITGVYEKLYVYQSIKVMQSAVPSIKNKKIIGITDYSPTGNAISRQFALELRDKMDEINWDIKRVKNWEEYKSLIKEINEDENIGAIYPVALTLKVNDTLNYSEEVIFKWTIENNLKPEMALNYYYSKLGLFGGAAVDFEHMGYQSGIMVGKLLNGIDIKDIPIEDAQEYSIVFNAKRYKTLKIVIPISLITAADMIYKD